MQNVSQQITANDLDAAVGFIPPRYPKSENNSDNTIKLARKTEWITQSEQSYHGLGQRIFTTDVDDDALLNCRSIHFNCLGN